MDEGGTIILAATTGLVMLALVVDIAYGSRCPKCKAWFAKRTVDRSYNDLLHTGVFTIKCASCNHQWNELRETKKQLILGFVSEFFVDLFAAFFR